MSSMLSAKGSMHEDVLPSDLPERSIIGPTRGRFGELGSGDIGFAGRMIRSALESLERDDSLEGTRVVFSDTTPGENARARRSYGLSEATAGLQKTPEIFMLTPQSQQKAAEMIAEMTGISRRVIDAVMLEEGYGNQRAKVDLVSRGPTLSIDDDIIIPERYGVLKNECMPAGFRRMTNSQMIVPDSMVADSEIFEWRENSLTSLFDYLGRKLGDIRKTHSDLQASFQHVDTMHQALPEAMRGGVAQFRVDYDPESLIPESDDARVVGAWPIKHVRPDYRTIAIAKAHLTGEFPSQEVPMQSVLSGDNRAYAHQSSKTNVDSAVFAWDINDQTENFPRWFVTSGGISNANPLKTVTSSYRADNEMLPMLLGILSKAQNETLVYMSGLQAQAEHHRALSGYRFGVHEQAAASLVGNVAATEAAARMSFNPSEGNMVMEAIPNDYSVPEEKAHKIFDELSALAMICQEKAREITGRKGMDETVRTKLIEQYHAVHSAIEGKLGGFDFDLFRRNMNDEIRQQLRYYESILRSYPRIVSAVRELINKSLYPVERFVTE